GGEGGRGHGASEPGRGRDADGRAVQGRPVAEGGRPRPAERGRDDDAGLGLAVALEGDRDAEDRQAVCEVHRAVDRIDHPAFAGRALGAPELLAEDGDARRARPELAVDERLDARVPLGDEVGRELLGANLAGVAPTAEELGAGKRPELERDVARFRRPHFLQTLLSSRPLWRVPRFSGMASYRNQVAARAGRDVVAHHRSRRIATALRALSRKLGEAATAASMVARSMVR